MKIAVLIAAGAVLWMAYPTGDGLDLATTAQAVQATAQRTAYQDRFITNEGRRIHYLDWGTAGKRPFIMLHGINRSGHMYDQIAPHFQRDYHVIAMDIRGHGDSDWHPSAAYLVEDLVKDLHALVEQRGLRDIVITGCSIGGRVAQVYAGLHPDRVGKVIVEDVGPERPESVSNALTSRIQAEVEGWASEEELLSSMRRGQTRVPEETHRNWIRHETKKLSNGRVVWKYDPNFAKALGPVELWGYIKRIKAPTLYVLGANSKIVPRETQEKLKATLPNIEVVTVPDAGHYPHQDTPGVWLAIVKAFLAG